MFICISTCKQVHLDILCAVIFPTSTNRLGDLKWLTPRPYPQYLNFIPFILILFFWFCFVLFLFCFILLYMYCRIFVPSTSSPLMCSSPSYSPYSLPTCNHKSYTPIVLRPHHLNYVYVYTCTCVQICIHMYRYVCMYVYIIQLLCWYFPASRKSSCPKTRAIETGWIRSTKLKIYIDEEEEQRHRRITLLNIVTALK